MSGDPSSKSNVLIIASEPSCRHELSSVAGKFAQKMFFAGDGAEALQIIEAVLVDVILIEATPPYASIFQFIGTVKSRSREAAAIFLVTDKADAEVCEAFYEGISGIFLRPIDQQELVEGIVFSHASELGFQRRVHPRKSLVHSRVAFEIESQTSHGFGANLSVGGMSINSIDVLPVLNQIIEVKLSFPDQNLFFSVNGTVRWVRSSFKFGKPKGFGIQFIDLAVEARTAIESLVRLNPL